MLSNMTEEEKVASIDFIRAHPQWHEWACGARVWYNRVYTGSLLWTYECALQGVVHFIGNDGVSPSIEVIEAASCYPLLSHPATKGVFLERIRILTKNPCHVHCLNGQWQVCYSGGGSPSAAWKPTEALALASALDKLSLLA